MISHEKGYEEKELKKHLTWLLKTIKEISSGLDKLGNDRVTYYNALQSFILIRMGETQS